MMNKDTQMQSQKKKQSNPSILVNVLVAILVISFLVIAFVKLFSPRAWSPAVQHYVVSISSSKFQVAWSLDNVFARQPARGVRPLALAASNEYLFLLGSLAQDKPSSLHTINLSTGQVEANYTIQSRTEVLAVGENYFYLGVPSLGKIDENSTTGAAFVAAYEITSGQQVWRTYIRGARGIHLVHVFENMLSVIGSTATITRYQMLDADSGQVRYNSETSYPILISDNAWYSITPPNQLRAVEIEKVLWQREFDQRVLFLPPVMSNHIIIGRTGEVIGNVFGLDSVSGDILWESDDVVYSNVIADRGIVYFLTEQAELKAVDAQTGQIIASVQFVPDAAQEHLTQSYLYSVAASNGIVVVYLGDSRQLFAFRFLR